MRAEAAREEEVDLVDRPVVVDAETSGRRGHLVLRGVDVGGLSGDGERHVEAPRPQGVAAHLEFAAKGRELGAKAAHMAARAWLPGLDGEGRHGARAAGGEAKTSQRQKERQRHRAERPPPVHRKDPSRGGSALLRVDRTPACGLDGPGDDLAGVRRLPLRTVVAASGALWRHLIGDRLGVDAWTRPSLGGRTEDPSAPAAPARKASPCRS